MAQRASGKERKDLDLYETPEWVTQALLDNVRIVPQVWEPACGTGRMARVMTAAGHHVIATDIIDRGYSLQLNVGDFLEARGVPGPGQWAIVTNPPYGPSGRHAAGFIAKALMLAQRCNGQVAMLLKGDYDAGKTRRAIFADHPAFHCRITLLDRIRWFEGTGSPSENHAWYFWDFMKGGPPVVRYAERPK